MKIPGGCPQVSVGYFSRPRLTVEEQRHKRNGEKRWSGWNRFPPPSNLIIGLFVRSDPPPQRASCLVDGLEFPPGKKNYRPSSAIETDSPKGFHLPPIRPKRSTPPPSSGLSVVPLPQGSKEGRRQDTARGQIKIRARRVEGGAHGVSLLRECRG